MAHTKAQGSTQNGRDSAGQRLGVKRYGNQFVHAGEVLVRQNGTKFHPGLNVLRGKNDNLYAKATGVVRFDWVRRTPGRWGGRRRVSVIPSQAVENK
ncbi:50S ribosomal protein L27 [bacterium F11]|nr:50S ribosomal protein L27 [bacterium F11]